MKAYDRARMHRALDVVMDRAFACDSFLDDPKNIAGALKNLKGSGRPFGGPRIKVKPHTQDYPTWSQLKKNVKVRVKATGKVVKVLSTDVAWVNCSDGNHYTPKQLELV